MIDEIYFNEWEARCLVVGCPCDKADPFKCKFSSPSKPDIGEIGCAQCERDGLIALCVQDWPCPCICHVSGLVTREEL